MDERRRLQHVPGGFSRHPRGGEPSQFVTDEREKVGRRLAIAGRGGVQDLSDLWHEVRVYLLLCRVKTTDPSVYRHDLVQSRCPVCRMS